MAEVHVVPMPDGVRKLSRGLWPLHPPVFVPGTGEITEADRALAEELIAALDDQSREWYRRP